MGYSSALTTEDGGLDAMPDGSPLDTAMDGADADGAVPHDASAADAVAPADAAIDTGPPDVGPCDESPCKLVAPQCGCAAGLACQRPLGDDPTRGCEAPGTSGVNETCLVNSECDTALVCVATGFSTGLCTPYCASSADCGGRTCIELVVRTEDVGACASSCDPIAGSGCGGGAGCGVALTRDVPARALTYVPVCHDPALPAEGEPCPEFMCGPQLVCMGGSCQPTCEVGAGGCGAAACRSLSPPLMLGAREIGYCG